MEKCGGKHIALDLRVAFEKKCLNHKDFFSKGRSLLRESLYNTYVYIHVYIS